MTYLSNLLNGNLTSSQFIAEQRFLSPSYSIDVVYNQKYSYPVTTDRFSGYFTPKDAFCPSNQCEITQVSNETRKNGLIDIKFRSFFHAYNSISFYQFGIDSDGYTRYLPYTPSTPTTNPSLPTTCNIASTNSPLCLYYFENSQCSPLSTNPYFPYDVRCRSWYASGIISEANKAYFLIPRVSRTGSNLSQ